MVKCFFIETRCRSSIAVSVNRVLTLAEKCKNRSVSHHVYVISYSCTAFNLTWLSSESTIDHNSSSLQVYYEETDLEVTLDIGLSTSTRAFLFLRQDVLHVLFFQNRLIDVRLEVSWTTVDN